MLKTWMIADYLRPYARWRINRADPRDDDRNARAAIGLIDAAAYLARLDETERVIGRLAGAGRFAPGRFEPGAEGERIIRFWHYEDAAGGPAELLEALAEAAERARRPGGAAPA
ncbi:hypothetical protein [Actinomadura roseirufa]|uniref:hypothetical protein n=1 Tax=Actinomadura roseirufa TaxID=2094049 RepID=UPI0010418474|nr:hypothetical protein [Actinomadura roseirufa]